MTQEERIPAEQTVSEAPEGTTLESETLPEPISGTSVNEATTETLVEEAKVRILACLEDDDCRDSLRAGVEETAARLGVPAEKLMDEVSALLTREESSPVAPRAISQDIEPEIQSIVGANNNNKE